MKIQYVDISKVKKPFPYCYHYDLQDAILQKSVIEQGIISPLWLVKKESIQIVDGHRRWRAAKSARISQLPAYIYPEKDLVKTFIFALHLNWSVSKLSAIERLKALLVARQYFDAPTFNKVSHIMELSNFPNLFEIANKIKNMPIWLQTYCHRSNFSLKLIGKISQYPVFEYRQWLKIAAILGLNGVELIQVLEYLRDISLRDRVEPYQLWDSLDIASFLASDFNVPQKVQHLKKMIELKRFPIKNQTNENIQRGIKNLSKVFSNFFQISWDKNLEQPGIIISFQLKKKGDLKQAISWLSNREVQNGLIELINQYDKTPQNKNC